MGPIESTLKWIADYGITVVISSIVIVGLWYSIRLLHKYFNAKIEASLRPPVHCPRALAGECPAEHIPTPELVALIRYKSTLKNARDLYGHSIFSSIRHYRTITIPSFNIENPGRKALVQDLLDIKFQTVATELDVFIRDNMILIESDQLVGSLMEHKVVTWVSQVVAIYESQYRTLGMPEAAVAAFRIYHEESIETLLKQIESIAHSDWLNSSTERLALLFNAIEAVIDAAIIDAETVISNLNGSLSGQRYKQYVLGPCKPKPIPMGHSGIHYLAQELLKAKTELSSGSPARDPEPKETPEHGEPQRKRR